MPVRFSPFSVDAFTEFLLALPPRESGNGVLALVPVSPSPRKALHVEDLRAVVPDEEVAGVPDAGEAARPADRLPPRRAVARPRRALDVAERLGEELPCSGTLPRDP